MVVAAGSALATSAAGSDFSMEASCGCSHPVMMNNGSSRQARLNFDLDMGKFRVVVIKVVQCNGESRASQNELLLFGETSIPERGDARDLLHSTDE